MSPMEIKFVKANPSFAEFFYEHRQDPINQLYNPLVKSTVESLRDRLAKTSSDFNDFEKAESFFWILMQNSTPIGIASIQNINRMMLTAEIGYGVQPEYRGKGMATNAVQLLVKQAFEQTPLRKLIAFVHEENHASRKLLEKVGFTQEGVLREHYLIESKPANEIIYGLLRHEC